MAPIVLTVREAGLVATERGASIEVAWSRHVRLREADHHFLLYKTADLYAIVPKRGFASASDMAAFQGFLARRPVDHSDGQRGSMMTGLCERARMEPSA